MERLVPITSIQVPMRARVDYGDITDLARKIIATKGLQFNYVTVEQLEDGYLLLAGGRRLRAYELILRGNSDTWDDVKPTEEMLLSYTQVPCTVLKDLTPEDRIRVELIENLSRKDFTWPEASTLVTAFHDLMQAKYGKGSAGPGKSGWSVRDTSKELGLNPADVVYYLQLKKALDKDPSLGDIRARSKALTKLKRNNQETIADLLGIDGYSVDDIQIICGDSKVFVPTLLDESVDLIVTDPPWGIGFEESITQDRRDSATTDYDTDYNIANTLEVLTHCYNKLKPNCGIYMFYSSFPEKVLEGQKLLTLAGFTCERLPLIWYKKHILAHQSHESRHGLNYESILYAYKLERPFFNHTQRNVFEHQVAFAERIHASEKPESLLVDIIKLHGKEGDLVLDPWGGSCKVADACKLAQRRCVVVELESSLVNMATLRVRGI